MTRSKAVQKITARPGGEELAAVTGFSDAFKLAANYAKANGMELANAADLGDGFMPLDKGKTAKDYLVKKPFVILTADFGESLDYPNEDGTPGVYVTCRIVTKDDEKIFFVDGSTGICKQLQEYVAINGGFSGMYVPGGLNRSDYTKTLSDGTQITAVTYYLSTLLK